MVTVEYTPQSRYRTGPEGGVSVADKADIACLSTDEKPVDGIKNGSCLYEMDTSTFYFFDEENKRWLPMKGGGANVSP